MVSFYTDSPRLGVRNTHAPEKSQDRIGGTLWEYPERYLEHSAVLRADRIKTPLLNITGDQDPNVPASQSREMYYALRRLGKEVEWVRYVNGGHRPAEQRRGERGLRAAHPGVVRQVSEAGENEDAGGHLVGVQDPSPSRRYPSRSGFDPVVVGGAIADHWPLTTDLSVRLPDPRREDSHQRV
jgi:fermentation-respiration switch protein FrsA (DUF1100 family)